MTVSATSHSNLLNIYRVAKSSWTPLLGRYHLTPVDVRLSYLDQSYTLTVSWTSGSKCEISFEKTPWPIVDDNTYNQARLDISRIRPVYSHIISENYDWDEIADGIDVFLKLSDISEGR